MIIRETRKVDLDSNPCPHNKSGIHMWGFRPTAMYCGKCGWTIPIARFICESCHKVTRIFEGDISPLSDIFECEHCGKHNTMHNNRVQ